MAAETLTATRGKAGFPLGGPGDANNLKVAWGTYAIAANVEDGDIFEMCRLPANATVLGGELRADPLDTHATPTLDMDIGWASNGTDAADPDGFGNLGVWDDTAVTGYKTEAGHIFPLQGVVMTAGYKTFSAETVIQIEANAAAATFAAGDVTVVVYYTVP
jgi:hypothetical protein